MYQFHPLSFRSLETLLERENLGQRARFERFVADLLYILAAGRNIDMDRADRFSVQLEEVFANPFVHRQKQPQTAAEIKDYILGKLEALINGSDDARREDRTG